MSEKSQFRIPTPVLELLEREALKAYPEECCGILLGRGSSPGEPIAEVSEVAVAPNSASDRREERYAIDPKLVLQVQQEARARQVEVLGYYHSHPCRSATPSQSDLESAWPEVRYLILAVEAQRVTGVKCWRLSEVGETFEEVDIGYS